MDKIKVEFKKELKNVYFRMIIGTSRLVTPVISSNGTTEQIVNIKTNINAELK